jgi:hydroxymethylglutaryl-CoA lyase
MVRVQRERVELCECFARDGLQHESTIVPTDAKVQMIDAIADAGFRRIEAGSFSHPERVPQFRDIEPVLQSIKRLPGTIYKTTCVNVRAAERAVAAAKSGFGPDEISFPISASETANYRNTRRTIAQSKQIFTEYMDIVRSSGLTVTATAAAAYGYADDGPTPVSAVLDLVAWFLELGVDNVIIGDSDGYGYPDAVTDCVGSVVKAFPEAVVICHFHDNRGVGIANVMAALDVGVRYFDCSLGGIGGKPSGMGEERADRSGDVPAGNVATEDLVFLLENHGFDTGIDLGKLMQLSARAEQTLARHLNSRVARSGPPFIRGRSPADRPGAENSDPATPDPLSERSTS